MRGDMKMSDLNKFFEKQMQNEEFRKEYNRLTPKYEIIKEIIKELSLIHI